MTVVHRRYSVVVSKVVSKSYGREWYVAELDKLRWNVCAFHHNVVCRFCLVCKFWLFTLKFFLDRLIEDVLGIVIHLCWMRRYRNNLTEASNLRSITHLNNLQRIWLRWCLVWIVCEPMQPERRRTEKTIVLQAFPMKCHCTYNDT